MASRDAPGRETGAAVSVCDVCFSYGDEEVLHNVSFDLPDHSFCVVVGPNGGGKTTLLKLLLGELEPRFGSVRVLGGTPASARRRTGYVPQSVVFDPDFPITVLEATMLGRVATRVLGGFSRRDREAASDALARVGLEGFGDRPFSALSGGQRQRVALAQALCAAPDLYLLDEPTANVDVETERDLVGIFAELAGEASVVMVSHNLGVVAARATHLLCVNRGADLHCLVSPDGETRLMPFDEGAMAVVMNRHPEHIEHLLEHRHSPHRGQAADGSGRISEID